jgi:hypothetical protein
MFARTTTFNQDLNGWTVSEGTEFVSDDLVLAVFPSWMTSHFIAAVLLFGTNNLNPTSYFPFFSSHGRGVCLMEPVALIKTSLPGTSPRELHL